MDNRTKVLIGVFLIASLLTFLIYLDDLRRGPTVISVKWDGTEIIRLEEVGYD